MAISSSSNLLIEEPFKFTTISNMIALFSLWRKDKVPLEKTERAAGQDKMVSEYSFLVYTKEWIVFFARSDWLLNQWILTAY